MEKKFIWFKKNFYDFFFPGFYSKVEKVDKIAANSTLIKRPYKGIAKKIQIYSDGIESSFYFCYGIGIWFYLMTGAFSKTGYLKRKAIYLSLLFLATSFMSDFTKGFIVYKTFQLKIEKIDETYKFPSFLEAE